MSKNNRPLNGVKVVELATFIAAPCATRFFADQGADVIKVEALGGDGTRWAAESEGRPIIEDDMQENLTFDLENSNKRGLCMNLKNPECFQAFMELLAQADIFVTNWRPQALARMELSYEKLKVKFPKLIYASVTGYGENGPDKDLPGYDYTAFFTRSGILGSLYEKGTVPMNLIPSMGDRQTGMCLAAGILAALYQAEKTGKGEKVSISLLGTAIFMQGTMVQTAQYELIKYPLTKSEAPNPLMNCYQTKDKRWIQTAMPIYNAMMPGFAKALGCEEWITDPRFENFKALKEGGNNAAFVAAVSARYAQLTVDEVVEALTKADIPFALAQTWDEVLKDPQAWANDCFYEQEYKHGKRIVVRNPVRYEENGLPPTLKAPKLGEHTIEILKDLGCSNEKIDELLQSKQIRCEA